MTETLAQHLAKLIEIEGPIPISTFMQVALAHPEHGYYRAHAAIGAEGDFITAPEISQLFGEMVGVWVLRSWIDLGMPHAWQLIELGPGRGTLMADIIRALKLRPQALEAAHFHLVETSLPLRELQRKAIGDFTGRAHWHNHLESVSSAPGVIVANEFFDALPIRQFLKLKGVWCERRVALGNSSSNQPRFEFIAVPTLFDVEAEISHAWGAADGQILELSGASRTIAAEIGRRLSQQPGRALIIDYGYSGERHGDTLQALRKHKKISPLDDVGFADLTAHVDFAALAQAAEKEGAQSFGPVRQRAFLSEMGIKTRLAALSKHASASQKESIERGVHRLTAASEMGDLFRVLALSSPKLPAPPGFEISQ
ncbi:MAG: SAM-dependent methyltransferase [Alphaproteobacteria bacterium]